MIFWLVIAASIVGISIAVYFNFIKEEEDDEFWKEGLELGEPVRFDILDTYHLCYRRKEREVNYTLTFVPEDEREKRKLERLQSYIERLEDNVERMRDRADRLETDYKRLKRLT